MNASSGNLPEHTTDWHALACEPALKLLESHAPAGLSRDEAAAAVDTRWIIKHGVGDVIYNAE